MKAFTALCLIFVISAVICHPNTSSCKDEDIMKLLGDFEYVAEGTVSTAIGHFHPYTNVFGFTVLKEYKNDGNWFRGKPVIIISAGARRPKNWLKPGETYVIGGVRGVGHVHIEIGDICRLHSSD